MNQPKSSNRPCSIRGDLNVKPVTDEAPREILDLAEAIALLPLEYRLRVEPLVNRVLDNAKRRRRILSLVQDAWANCGWT